MSFPKKCTICGLMRMSEDDRPCLDKRKLPVAVQEKVEEECPAACIMYA